MVTKNLASKILNDFVIRCCCVREKVDQDKPLHEESTDDVEKHQVYNKISLVETSGDNRQVICME